MRQIDDADIGFTAWAPIGMLMPGCDPVQPDLVVVRREDAGMIYDRRIHGVPVLIVEVLSSSNAEKDTDIKRSAYARADVPEYWMVRPIERDLLICTRPDINLGSYLQTDHIAAHGILVSPTLPCRAEIAAFFAGSPDEAV